MAVIKGVKEFFLYSGPVLYKVSGLLFYKFYMLVNLKHFVGIFKKHILRTRIQQVQ